MCVFLTSKCLELVVEKDIELGKEPEEVLSLIWCEMSAQICHCSNVTNFTQTVQCFCCKDIVKRKSIFVILFVVVNVIHFEMHFLISDCLEFVVEKNVQLGKELEEVLSFFWHELSA